MSEPRSAPAGIAIAVALGLVLVGALAWFLVPSEGIPKSYVNERAAISSLREACTAEELLKAGDRDGNGAQDYWTGDLSGLHRLADREGKPVALIRAELAGADADPLPESRSAPPSLTGAIGRKPSRGYWFRALVRKHGEDLQRDGPDADAKAWEHPAMYGFVAWPAEYGKDGNRTFLLGEDARVWSKDLGAGGGEALREWPGPKGADLKALGWAAE